MDIVSEEMETILIFGTLLFIIGILISIFVMSINPLAFFGVIVGSLLIIGFINHKYYNKVIYQFFMDSRGCSREIKYTRIVSGIELSYLTGLLIGLGLNKYL